MYISTCLLIYGRLLSSRPFSMTSYRVWIFFFHHSLGAYAIYIYGMAGVFCVWYYYNVCTTCVSHILWPMVICTQKNRHNWSTGYDEYSYTHTSCAAKWNAFDEWFIRMRCSLSARIWNFQKYVVLFCHVIVFCCWTEGGELINYVIAAALPFHEGLLITNT